ncbi:MAG: tetratricopeptide repeat protein [Promethearchaeota archaeon]
MKETKFQDLLKAEKLLYKCKFEEVQNILEHLEKIYDENSTEYLSILLLKGRLYFYREEYKNATEIAESARILSLKLNITSQYVDSLLIKAYIVFLGRLEESKQIINEVESLLNDHKNNSSLYSKRHFNDFLIIKAIVYHYTSNLDYAYESINQWILKNDKDGEKLDFSRVYIILGDIYLYKNKADKALENFEKSCNLYSELEYQRGIATSLQYLALAYYYIGNLDRSQSLCERSLSIPKISTFTKSTSFHLLGAIFKEKGELDRALRIYKKVAKIRDIEQYFEEYLTIILGIGTIHRMKGNYNLALENFLKCYTECKNINSLYGIGSSLFYLILTFLDINNIEKAESYLSEFESVSTLTKSESFLNMFLVAKALILRKSKRLQNRTQAAEILKRVIEKEALPPQLLLLTLANLCDFLQYEMIIMDNLDILNEINPLISKMLKIAKNQNSYLWLAETKLLQAKLSLIKMDIPEAKNLMTEAQKIAEMHNLNLIAQRISYDYDSLLDQSVLWDELFERNAPVSERIKLASLNGVLGRLQGKNAFLPPKITKEKPILLLIMSKDGISHFSHSFQDYLDFEPLFSSFLSAFNSFGAELFSLENTIERINFGEYRILVNHIENFIVCYIIKGQSYSAKRKLLNFTTEIRVILEIWNALNLSVKSGKMLEMHNPPVLGKLVNQIFYEK